MPRLLIVHHTPSPATHTMLDAVVDGTRAEGITGVDVDVRAALASTAVDALDADGYLLGTPANLGTMSGALKHWFDTVYYPCLADTRGRPYGVFVHGNDDVDGALRDVAKIAAGLGWREAHAPVRVLGEPSRDDRDACWDLGATLAAGLMG